MKDIVNVLGVPYKIEVHSCDEDKMLSEKFLDGYCASLEKKIVISDMCNESYKYLTNAEKNYCTKETLRHELLHAFFNECGLGSNANAFSGAWVDNEEMIDFFAKQFSKILEIYREAECL